MIFSTHSFGQRYSYGDRRQQKNIYDQTLEICSLNPVTGWFRDGYARTDNNDRGLHVVCATMTQEVCFQFDHFLNLKLIHFESKLRKGHKLRPFFSLLVFRLHKIARK